MDHRELTGKPVPPLGRRLIVPLVVAHIAGAARLVIDFVDPDAAMWVGQYYAMPFVFAWIGWTGRWGRIGWPRMFATMVVIGFAAFGVWTAIAYTTGQFLEWTEGRFYPGEAVVGDAGEFVYEGGRAAPPADTALGKLGNGLLHGLITSVASTVWCTVFGTALIWLPGLLGRGRPAADASPAA